jgi:hypothetical protein
MRPKTMNISKFDDLLLAARQQVHAQRLLLVFTTAELPDDPTPEQRVAFEEGTGGALVPAMCVHKTPDEIGNFEQLKLQAAQFGRPWRVLFASSLSGKDDGLPSVSATEHFLGAMEESIKQGRLDRLIAFDANGDAIAWGSRSDH